MIYLFQNPKTLKIKEVLQSANDKHEYFEDGVKWDRVWTKPFASVDTKFDENNPQDFSRKTGTKKDTLGSLFDRSKELSLKREQKEGKDKYKEQYYKDWSKQRGKTHPDIAKKKAKERLDKLGVSIE